MTKPNKETLYNQSKQRWIKAEASLTGIMDGFESVNDCDIANSCKILENLITTKTIEPNYIIDCGAGIGRVSQYALTKYFANTDLFERDEKFVEYCKKNFAENSKVKEISCDSLQDFQFNKLYDAIWVQWCLQDLQDDDLAAFLMRCKNNLTKSGVIIVKENIMHEGRYLDVENGCDYRSSQAFRGIFAKCGLSVMQEGRIENWPDTLLPVACFVLR